MGNLLKFYRSGFQAIAFSLLFRDSYLRDNVVYLEGLNILS